MTSAQITPKAPHCPTGSNPLASAFKTACALATTSLAMAAQAAPACEVRSGAQLTPVIELYTSEGCSSCPPADQWLSKLKGQPVVAQAFHVAYWDYIGWVDRFANPTFTERQRAIASANQQSTIYTPQVVRNGRDWRDWTGWLRSTPAAQAAGASIVLRRTDAANAGAGGTTTAPVSAPNPEQFSAEVTPTAVGASWTAYWTITEHGHSSRVKAGENRGETLQHDFVVRQYTPVGRYQGRQRLDFAAPPAHAEHPRQINLVVYDSKTGEPLQAVSLACSL